MIEPYKKIKLHICESFFKIYIFTKTNGLGAERQGGAVRKYLERD